MAITLGEAVNRGLVTIGEPEITAFDTANQLQIQLIDTVNEAVVEVREACWYAEWSYQHDAFATVAELTTGTVAVTKDSATVTSKDADGNDAQNFTDVAVGDWFRRTGDLTSYKVANVDTGSNPHTLTLEDNYLGETSTSVAYKVIRDTYALTQSEIDQVVICAYGDNAYGFAGKRLRRVDMPRLYVLSGGDLHRDTSGLPRYIARIGNDSNEDPRFVLWPYPNQAYLFDLWHTTKYSGVSSFDANLFGSDAPDVAYDAVVNKVRWRASVWDKDQNGIMVWGGRDGQSGAYGTSMALVKRREMRDFRDDNQMSVATYRDNNTSYGFRTESQIAFDRAGGGNGYI